MKSLQSLEIGEVSGSAFIRLCVVGEEELEQKLKVDSSHMIPLTCFNTHIT
jgi:hypothetical protein